MLNEHVILAAHHRYFQKNDDEKMLTQKVA